MPLDPAPVPEELHVAMTSSATRFVGPPSFQGVTGNPVTTDMWSGAADAPEPHVFLGDWAQVVLLAPATANVIARAARGQSDDIVTAVLLAARCASAEWSWWSRRKGTSPAGMSAPGAYPARRRSWRRWPRQSGRVTTSR